MTRIYPTKLKGQTVHNKICTEWTETLLHLNALAVDVSFSQHSLPRGAATLVLRGLKMQMYNLFVTKLFLHKNIFM